MNSWLNGNAKAFFIFYVKLSFEYKEEELMRDRQEEDDDDMKFLNH